MSLVQGTWSNNPVLVIGQAYSSPIVSFYSPAIKSIAGCANPILIRRLPLFAGETLYFGCVRVTDSTVPAPHRQVRLYADLGAGC